MPAPDEATHRGSWLTRRVGFWIVAGYFVAWGGYAALLFLPRWRPVGAAEFGDAFGPFNAFVSGLAMLGVIGAILLQREQIQMQARELRLQSEQLRLQREELELNRKELARTASAQEDSAGLLRRQVQLHVRPIMVFSLNGPGRWKVHNVGTGPTIELLVADPDANGLPRKIVNCAPLSAGSELDVPWLRANYELVAIYRDINDNTYTTTCSYNRNYIAEENRHPEWKANRDQWIEDPVWAGRDTARFRESDLEPLSVLQLELLRSEIYARYGYIFPRLDFRTYFGRQSWYEPREKDYRIVQTQFTPGDRSDSFLILGFQYRNNKTPPAHFSELMDPHFRVDLSGVNDVHAQ